ncbi:hypothetical protein CSUI_008428, partial [Cystoisospora suis]
RIKCLYDLVCESDSFRSPPTDVHRGRGGAGGQSGSGNNPEAKNVFPYVDEKAALVRDLPLSEILYSRHTHRLQSRRHPFWIDMKYKKNRTKIPYIYRRRVAKQEAQAREYGLSRAHQLPSLSS